MSSHALHHLFSHLFIVILASRVAHLSKWKIVKIQIDYLIMSDDQILQILNITPKIKMDAPPLSQQELSEVYNWVDQIPLTRPKKNITRDFADGVLLAEIISHYFPKLVETHNYVATTSASTKLANWNTLNKKVLKKLNYQVSKNDIEHIITATPDVIERVLKVTHNKIKGFVDKKKNPEGQIKQEFPKEQIFHKVAKNQQLKEVLSEKDNAIKQLKSTVEILELKIQKMEQLIKIKDSKIQSLVSKLQQAGLA